MKVILLLHSLRKNSRRTLVTLMLALACLSHAQQPNVAVQREAMKRLNYLAGNWSGEASVSYGPGEPMKLLQTEAVQYKLDGLLMLIEGTGRDTAGKIVFQALATIAYDDATSTYNIRAFNSGRYLETELTPTAKGFTWGFTSGPVKVSNAMHLDDNGDWLENTDTTFGAAPPRQSVEMKLHRQP